MRRIVNGKTTIRVNKSYEAEPLEKTLKRALTSGEPISTTAPQVFTEKKDGVRAEYDIRTDRFEVAREAMGLVSKVAIAKREGNKNTAETPSGTSDSN